jgi:hypothetical protein
MIFNWAGYVTDMKLLYAPKLREFTVGRMVHGADHSGRAF